MKYCAAVKLLVAGIFCGGGALAGSYTFTTVSDPNAAAGETFAYGINDAGQVSGTYVDSSGYSHGYRQRRYIHNNRCPQHFAWEYVGEGNQQQWAGRGEFQFLRDGVR